MVRGTLSPWVEFAALAVLIFIDGGSGGSGGGGSLGLLPPLLFSCCGLPPLFLASSSFLCKFGQNRRKMFPALELRCIRFFCRR